MSDNTSCSGLNYCVHGSLARSCEICERDKEIARLKKHVQFWNEAAIEYKRQLNETIRRGPESAGLHIITDKQIDDAWGDPVELYHGDERYIKASAIGIVECPECGGSGVSTPREFRLWECCLNCHGHGWVREERGDDL